MTGGIRKFHDHGFYEVALLLIGSLLLLTACPSEEWIQVSNSRPATYAGNVQYLEGPPKRPFVVGIITPPAREAEAVKAMRKQVVVQFELEV